MKRFEYALWALKAIRRRAPEVALVITGQETEYTDLLRYLVGGLGLEESVHFVGLVKQGDLQNLYRTAVVYVYPSPEEDFGMGIVEAMAAGTPVVAWKNGGPTVTVRHGETGFLVQPYDTEKFAESLHMLVSSADLAERMGRAGHLVSVESFSYVAHNKILERSLADAARIRSIAPTNVTQAGRRV
jgi:glycosyltransferase involved in cell wall biosynthesis